FAAFSKNRRLSCPTATGPPENRKGQVSWVTPGPEKSSGKKPGVTRASGERAGRSPDGRDNAPSYPGYRTNSYKYASSLPLGLSAVVVVKAFRLAISTAH